MSADHTQPKEPTLSFSAFFPGKDAHGQLDRSAVQGASIKRVREPWSKLVALLNNAIVADTKDGLPLIKLARFGDKPTRKGSYRHDANMVEVWGVEGDYDGGEVTLDQAAAMLRAAGITAYLYTTPSHTPERPRWRVLSPLSKACTSAERARFVAKLNGVLGGILARESFTPSQAFFMGRVKGREYLAINIEGAALDLVETSTGYVYADGGAKASTLSIETDFARELVVDRVNIETLSDLRSALGINPATNRAYIDPDDRVSWVAIAHALKCIGDEGRDIWLEWSALSPKFNDGASDPCAVWDSCDGTRSDYRAVFTKAAAGGWLNPKSAEAIKANATAATRVDRSDSGNVAVMAQLSDGDLRWVSERKVWLLWTGHGWEVDVAKAHAAALRVAEHYIQEAAKLRQQAKTETLDDDGRKHVEKAAKGLESWALCCRNKRYLDSMKELAKVDERFVLSADQLDRDPWLFGVANGVVDLRTGTLRDASRDEFVTQRSPVAFNPNAIAPRWLEFISEITATPLNSGRHSERPALARYMQRALGYWITGGTWEHKMFIAVGPGANGKSVMLDVLKPMVGPYWETISPEVLMATKFDADSERATPGRRKLAGARAAICSESKDGHKLDVALVKQHTGGGFTSARGLHENSFTFEITHKVVLMTNHKPSLDHMDEAMRGRLHILPFDMCWNRPGHPDRDPNLPDGDKLLPEKLKAEAEGILAWLIAGAVLYHQEGLEPPPEVAIMTREYFKDQDTFRQWLDSCETCEPKDGMRASDLLTDYESWCIDEGHGRAVAGNATSFGGKLKTAGIAKAATNTGKRYGLRAGKDGHRRGVDPLLA